MSILNVINSLLSYDDPSVTDSPTRRGFDWTRRLTQIQVANSSGGQRSVIPAGGNLLLFDGTVATSLNTSSILSIQPITGMPSSYRLSVTSGPASFVTARSISGVTSCVVTINNFATATFQFNVGTTISGVVAGDTLRISGAILGDTGPFAFNPANAGYWVVLGATSTSIMCARLPGQSFSGVNETVAPLSSDFQAYSAAGVQKGNSVSITGAFSLAVQGTYPITAVTPSSIDIFSSIPLPVESATYTSSSITFYTNAKRIIYVEVDQPASIRMNGSTDDSNLITPIVAGNPDLVGFMSKWGNTFSATVVNKSVSPMNVLWFTAE